MRVPAVVLLSLMLSTSVLAGEMGYPVITLMRQETHGGGSQTFDVAHDARGRMWFANIEGVLIYDGAWWSRVSLPGGVAFYVQPMANGDVGAVLLDDFGFLRAGKRGSLEYQSLTQRLPEDLRRGANATSLCAVPNGLLFVGPRFAARWDGRNLAVLARFAKDDPRRRCSSDGGKVWVEGSDGLVEIGGKTTFRGRRIDFAKRDLVIVRNEGIFHADETPYDTDASAWLRGKAVMGVRTLHDGRMAVATLRAGLLIMTPDCRIDQVIDKAGGLPEDQLYDVEEDREGALWLAFDTSVGRIDLSMPVTVLDARVGLKGALHAVTRHRGTLVAATADGVFDIEERAEGARAERIGGIPFPWSLLSVGDDLIVGTFGGIDVVRGSSTERIAGTDDYLAYELARSSRDPSLVWIGTEEGVGKVRRKGAQWRFEGIVPGSIGFVRGLVEKDGVLFASSDTEGAMRLDPDGRITRYGSGNVQVLDVAGRVLFFKDGMFLKIAERRLVPDPLLGHVRAAPDVSEAGTDAAGNIWLGSRPPRRVHRLSDGRYENESHPIGALEGDIDTFFADPDGVMWLGSERGLYRVGSGFLSGSSRPPTPIIHRVVAGDDRVLVDGNGSLRGPATLPHNFHRLRIEVAPLSFRSTAYQYRLDPIDSDWTSWTPQAFLDFTTLAGDDYTFRVRTRDAAGAVSGEAQWSFTVLRPWYARWWAEALWIALAAALIAVIVALRTRALRRRARRLQFLIDGQTETLRDMVEQLRIAKGDLEQANARLEKLSFVDPLTGVANRRYFDRALADEWQRGGPLSLILLDLDHFKSVNDTKGHSAGDECLRRVGDSLESIVRDRKDVVARWGGEEFAVLLSEADQETAVSIAERIRTAIAPLGVTASLGVATRIDHSHDSPSILIERADRALYAAKRDGRNCVRVEGGGWNDAFGYGDVNYR